MSSPAPGLPLAERADIHKSCKSIEALLNILNEYCEAAGAVVALQKKLAKALRETAGLKVTGEIAANAMHSSATIFEALSDIDSKFSKVADKEYDIVSAEVKKWFKKLAKEERAHDERMANANARIKQAGQAYEKKSKKKATDASEEHAKYINLISTLGPEVSQEKYNHALNVTQKHTTTTYGVAACLSRLADTEWQKSCECIRRFSPTIGPLGQWKAFCEGGWTGQIPPDLPDLDISNGQPTPQIENEPTALKPIEEAPRQHPPSTQAAATRLTPEPRELTEQQPLVPPPGYSTGPPSATESSNDHLRDQISARNSPTLTRQQPLSTAPAVSSEVPAVLPSNNLEPPKPGFVDANTGSVRSLSAFPTPPTHFPLPPPRQPQSQQSSYFRSTSSSSNLAFPSNNNQLAESPISDDNGHSGVSDLETSSRAHVQNFHDGPTTAPIASPPSPELRYRERSRITEEQFSPSGQEIRRPSPVRAQTSLPLEPTFQSSPDVGHRETRHGPSSSIDAKPSNTRSYNREEYDTQEFGVISRNAEMPSKSKTVENTKYPRALERMDTGASSGSIVAAMRNRYSSNPGSTSPPPRELPRLPLSVNDLATRYQPADTPLSPRARAASPPVMRQQSLPLLDTAARQAQESYLDRIHNSEEDSPRRQRYNDLAETERRTKEQELRERERELEMRTRELERDKARLHTLLEDERSGEHVGYRESSPTQPQASQFGLRPRERRTSLRHQLQRPLSQMELDDVGDMPTKAFPGSSSANSNPPIRPPSQYSYNATHLIPPSGTDTAQPLHSPKLGQRSQPPSPQPLAQSQYDSRIRDRYLPDNASNSNTNSTGGSTHAAYCGCETCSVNKYKNSGTSSSDQSPQSRYQPQTPVDVLTTENQRPEKPTKGGWMRRLSMPVGNAFSSDSKRHQSNNSVSSTTSNYGLGSGVGNTPVSGSRGLFSMDGKKNSSTTALLSSSTSSGDRGLAVQQDGRLGQSGDMGRRSMTNLGISGRR